MTDFNNAYTVNTNTKQGSTTSKSAYRPSEWSGLSKDKDKLIYIKSNIGGYFFDAVIKEDHNSSVRITEHPVQSGANISDHSFVLPSRLTLEIGMSDAMDSILAGQFKGSATKSISAYQQLLLLQSKRDALSVFTRLNFYKNMVIENISAPDDFKTKNGLKCTVQLKQIIVVDVPIITVSTRPQVTKETPKESIQTKPLTATDKKVYEYIKSGQYLDPFTVIN